MIGLRLKLWMAAVVAFLVALFGAFAKGRSAEKTKQEAKEANDYVEARKRADEADRNAGIGSWSERLHKHRDKQ